LDELKADSSHFKHRRTHIRALIHPSVLHTVQMKKKQFGGKKRLEGDGSSQEKTAAVLACFLSVGEARKLAE